MPQLKQVCVVTQGSQTVLLRGVDATQRIKAQYIFMVDGLFVPYTVAQDAVFNGQDTQVTLTGQYVAESQANARGVFVSDYTYPDLVPTIAQGDVGTAAVFTQAMYRLQDMIKAVAPAGLSLYSSYFNAVMAAKDEVAAADARVLANEADAVAARDAAQSANTAAQSAKTAASTSASNAQASASAAASSASAAATSNTNAANSATSASASKTAATTASTNAATSATQAATSATAAATSASQAATSATNAAGSATSASNSAQAANTSATSATGSASSASTQAGIATTKAGEAATSATASASSASSAATASSNAATSATTATTKATQAATSAGNAATSETNAAASATAAATSASTASTQAGKAATSASNAGASETAAAGSAATASTKASQASTSAANAATSETNAAASAAQAAQSAANAAQGQINADWNASSGAARILNKPSIPASKADIGLPLVENKSSSTIRSELNAANVTAALSYTPLDAAMVGAVNGVVPLDVNRKIAATYLPGFVDDVLEVVNSAALPGTGTSGILYVTLDSNKAWRWSGSGYVEISPSPGSTDAVPEGASNLYFTGARVLATLLNGLSTVSNLAISASDSVLSALGKLQKQITDLSSNKADKASPTFTGSVTAPTFVGTLSGNASSATTASSAASVPWSGVSGKPTTVATSGLLDALASSGGNLSGPLNQAHGLDIASAASINLQTATGDLVDVTGNSVISSIVLNDGAERTVRFTGSATLTHGAALVLPGAASIVTAAGDFAVFRGYAGGVVRCVSFMRAAGEPGTRIHKFQTLQHGATGLPDKGGFFLQIDSQIANARMVLPPANAYQSGNTVLIGCHTPAGSSNGAIFFDDNNRYVARLTSNNPIAAVRHDGSKWVADAAVLIPGYLLPGTAISNLVQTYYSLAAYKTRLALGASDGSLVFNLVVNTVTGRSMGSTSAPAPTGYVQYANNNARLIWLTESLLLSFGSNAGASNYPVLRSYGVTASAITYVTGISWDSGFASNVVGRPLGGARITDTSALLAYGFNNPVHAPSYLGATVVTSDATGATLNVGTRATLPATNAPSAYDSAWKVVVLSPTSAVILASGSNVGANIVALPVTISGTTLSFGTSWTVLGTVSQSAPGGNVDAVALDGTRLMLGWLNSADSGFLSARVLTISGTTIASMGAITRLSATPLTNPCAALALFQDGTLYTFADAFGICLTTSGNTVSLDSGQFTLPLSLRYAGGNRAFAWVEANPGPKIIYLASDTNTNSYVPVEIA